MSDAHPSSGTGPDLDRSYMHPIATVLFGWVGIRHIGRLIFRGLALVSLVLLLLDFVIPHHAHFQIEKVRGFYGLFGFSAFTFVVLTGWPLGRLLRRDETYYGEEAGEEENREGQS